MHIIYISTKSSRICKAHDNHKKIYGSKLSSNKLQTEDKMIILQKDIFVITCSACAMILTLKIILQIKSGYNERRVTYQLVHMRT